MSVQTAHIPAACVPGLAVGAEDSLYEVLQSRYQLYPARARETYFAGAAELPSAEPLGISAGAPVFMVERVTLLPKGLSNSYSRWSGATAARSCWTW